MPAPCTQTSDIGGKSGGRRLGFDVGGSDKKIAAVADNEVLFATSIIWDPYPQSDLNWHRREMKQLYELGASKLPGAVEAVGGSAPGIILDNEVKVGSLFRGLTDPAQRAQSCSVFQDVARELFGDIPFRLVNDGDVTALAGAMILKKNNLLGIAMGTSEAAGYTNAQGRSILGSASWPLCQSIWGPSVLKMSGRKTGARESSIFRSRRSSGWRPRQVSSCQRSWPSPRNWLWCKKNWNKVMLEQQTFIAASAATWHTPCLGTTASTAWKRAAAGPSTQGPRRQNFDRRGREDTGRRVSRTPVAIVYPQRRRNIARPSHGGGFTGLIIGLSATATTSESAPVAEERKQDYGQNSDHHKFE